MRLSSSLPLPRCLTGLRPLLGASLLVLAAAGPARAAPAAEPVRPLVLELKGRWIGNAVCFSPYRAGQAPGKAEPTDAQILSDLLLVQRYWSLLRIYDSSPVTERTLRLIRDHGLPLRVLLGCWIDADAVAANRRLNEEQVSSVVRLAQEYRAIVVAVNVGNETQVYWSDDRSAPEVLVRYIRRVRAAIEQPVGCADDYSYWKTPESARLADEVDFLMVNLYALWNGQPLKDAMAWTADQYAQIAALHPGRPIVISETGWATKRDATRTAPGGEASLMRAEASVAAQGEYLRQHYAWVDQTRVPTFLFEAFDEAWKGGGPATSADVAEKHWGVFEENRQPKASFAAFAKTYYR